MGTSERLGRAGGAGRPAGTVLTLVLKPRTALVKRPMIAGSYNARGAAALTVGRQPQTPDVGNPRTSFGWAFNSASVRLDADQDAMHEYA